MACFGGGGSKKSSASGMEVDFNKQSFMPVSLTLNRQKIEIMNDQGQFVTDKSAPRLATERSEAANNNDPEDREWKRLAKERDLMIKKCNEMHMENEKMNQQIQILQEMYYHSRLEYDCLVQMIGVDLQELMSQTDTNSVSHPSSAMTSFRAKMAVQEEKRKKEAMQAAVIKVQKEQEQQQRTQQLADARESIESQKKKLEEERLRLEQLKNSQSKSTSQDSTIRLSQTSCETKS